jgi:hypothetical protein
VLVTFGGAADRFGGATICGAGAGAGAGVVGSPFSRRVLVGSCGGRVATTLRAWIGAGGLTVAPVAGMTLAATGLISSEPCTGAS